jgi:hypothetical protein
MARKKKTFVIPIPKVKERGVMPKPTKVIPDPKKRAERAACRKKVAVAEEE